MVRGRQHGLRLPRTPDPKVGQCPERAEVVNKMKALQRQVDDGLQAPDAQMTVAQLLDRWYSDVLRHQVARNVADNYRSIADHHIRPALGQKRVANLTPADVDRLISQKIDEVPRFPRSNGSARCSHRCSTRPCGGDASTGMSPS